MKEKREGAEWGESVNRRASIRRSRRDNDKMSKVTPDKSTKALNKLAYDGQMDGKLYGMCAILHVLSTEFGWKSKRCSTFINRASDAALKTNKIDGSNVIVAVWFDRVNDKMPADTFKSDCTAAEAVRQVYTQSRDSYFKYICMFCLDALSDHYGFGTKRIDRVVELMAAEYELMRVKEPAWFRERCIREVEIEFS